METLALLIYTNQQMNAVLSGSVSYFAFDEVTKQLLLGSKNGVTKSSAVNILTVLRHADKEYKGLMQMHQDLSESAHPNCDGVLRGYSSTDPERHETAFCNNWVKYFGKSQPLGTAFVLAAFEREYNKIWPGLASALEDWLRTNDAELEAARTDR